MSERRDVKRDQHVGEKKHLRDSVTSELGAPCKEVFGKRAAQNCGQSRKIVGGREGSSPLSGAGRPHCCGRSAKRNSFQDLSCGEKKRKGYARSFMIEFHQKQDFDDFVYRTDLVTLLKRCGRLVCTDLFKCENRRGERLTCFVFSFRKECMWGHKSKRL